MAAIWHHCRACGEEGLTPDDERCPHCGIRAPVTLCSGCSRDIRDGEPWNLEVRPARAGSEGPSRWAFHGRCYWQGKRRLLHIYRAPQWQVVRDPRDPHEPLSPGRIFMGLGLLAAAVTAVLWLVVTAPRPQPVLSGADAAGATPSESSQISAIRQPPPWLEAALAVGGIAAGLWGIHRGLSRRRATE